MITVHVHQSFGDLPKRALVQVITTLLDASKVQLVDTPDANVVILQGVRMLEQQHTLDRHFVLVLGFGEKPPAKVQENVTVASVMNLVVKVFVAIGAYEKAVAPATATPPRPDQKRVLVVDDTARHVDAARKQLGADFNLMVVTNYTQALKAVQQPYDVVLLDLMLPATSETLGSDAIEKHVGEEMPLGLVLVFLAAAAGNTRIGVVTDLNHHAHPMSAAFDLLTQPQFVNGAVVLFSNRDLTSDGKDWKAVLERLLKE